MFIHIFYYYHCIGQCVRYELFSFNNPVNLGSIRSFPTPVQPKVLPIQYLIILWQYNCYIKVFCICLIYWLVCNISLNIPEHFEDMKSFIISIFKKYNKQGTEVFFWIKQHFAGKLSCSALIAPVILLMVKGKCKHLQFVFILIDLWGIHKDKFELHLFREKRANYNYNSTPHPLLQDWAWQQDQFPAVMKNLTVDIKQKDLLNCNNTVKELLPGSYSW